MVYDMAGGRSAMSRRMSRIVVRPSFQQDCMIRHSDGESCFSGVALARAFGRSSDRWRAIPVRRPWSARRIVRGADRQGRAHRGARASIPTPAVDPPVQAHLGLLDPRRELRTRGPFSGALLGLAHGDRSLFEPVQAATRFRVNAPCLGSKSLGPARMIVPGIEAHCNGDRQLPQVERQYGAGSHRALGFGEQVLTELPMMEPVVPADKLHAAGMAGLLDEELREQRRCLDVLGSEDRIEVLALLETVVKHALRVQVTRRHPILGIPVQRRGEFQRIQRPIRHPPPASPQSAVNRSAFGLSGDTSPTNRSTLRAERKPR